ncbi:MAG TPA: two-component regulator propeller domain-containing protein, partial [Acidobacteriaceae bacterium]|nr:two-component regulator propeller domain-containing protein [Acidobacteriaceae bacterium]
MQWSCWWILLLAMTYPAGALDPHRSLDQYGYQLWQTDSGLPQNTIHSILQTQDGYLWLGTEGGVVRFDGIRFVTFDVENTPQLKSNIVNDLFEDRAGALWISTSAGLVCYRAGEFTSYTTAGGLQSETVWFTGQDRAGRIWAFTANGPAFLNASRFHSIPGAQAAAPESRRAVAESDDGTLWLGSASGLFALHVAEGADPSLARHLLSGIRTEALAIDHAGNLWAGTRQGLERYSHGALEAIPIAGMHPEPEVTSLGLDSAGGLWAGTAAGLAQVKQGKAAAFAARSLDGRRIEGLFEDHQGALWI